MIYTIMQTKKPIVLKILKAILVATFWIFVWEAASRLVSRDNELLLLILPSPFTVLKKWIELVTTIPYIKAVSLTLLRIFIGYVIGCIVGFILGVLTHISNLLYALLSPIFKIIRAVPVVAIIILLYLFFDSSALPVIIVFLMVLPLIWQTIHDGLDHTDIKLLEMANIYNVSFVKTIFSIKLPYMIPSLITSCVNALGLAWKSGVAAEVICLPKISLGTTLWQSKGNVNFDEVYAITLTVIVLSVLIEIILKFLCKKYFLQNGD